MGLYGALAAIEDDTNLVSLLFSSHIMNVLNSEKHIAEIPDLTFISIHTVKKHNRSTYQNLEIATMEELTGEGLEITESNVVIMHRR